ncbi:MULTISPECIES: DUF4251 domain-containing protein [Chryseobacterium]|uniref:DUF4251 domain-containing protein n=1 Tax=Chryseobacterium camelliae TaxID=1265445 RepID=A0ABU0TML4_9FLAO|nr:MULTISPECIES: DUF4251 domain-containing protein [Chryseobacterium]MDT3408118.1 hypothetical protein [Pseudacidovorax intermedius]MDQ1098026.1 hypothetical protein [Chryseobacterium camelliae]MDQ1101954.1 hypothetical protein [Chryseobacterium sp. SORGH_AS_1048]MDR6085394.1 hypothetical protein [Chryseobacterium sp. SORGH_AS_0909]MDR6129756.1 hypothetical protein [Chryseobacterium sp. SORGH_AS_1175]
MKKRIPLLALLGFLFFFQNCSSQGSLDSKTVDTLVNSQEFTFYAQRANPTNYDVINVMNSIPNSTSTNILQLNGNYTVVLKNNMLDVALPYFGRVFNPTYGADNSFRFTTKNFTVNKSQNKKGNWIVRIKPETNDSKNIDEIIIEVYKTGKAFTSIRSNDRQPITYDGYISKNEATAKP